MALTFALTIVPLVLAAGVGLDVSRVVGARSQLQDATDAAGLAMAHYPAGTDIGVIKPKAEQWIKANLHGTTIDPNAVTVSVTPQDNGVLVTASTVVQPTLAAIVHLGPFPVASASTIKFDMTKVEVALVLDNTFSMSVPLDGGKAKIDVLKDAANKLIDTLMTPGNAGGVKVGVVPYGEYVNVGLANRHASWLSGVVDDFGTVYLRQAATKGQAATDPYLVPESCKMVTPSSTQCTGGVKGTCYTYKDGVATGSYSCWTTPQTCKTTYGTPYQQCTPAYTHAGSPAKPATAAVYGTKYTKWFGCVKHIAKSGPKLADPDPSTSYQGIMEQFTQWDDPDFNSGYCLTPILPLTADKSTVKDSITAMITSQSKPSFYDPNDSNKKVYYPETYVPGGLHWGVNVLSPSAPFSEGEAYDSKNIMPRKALILMTDGNNTRQLNSDGTVSVGTAGTYADQARMCQDAKDKGIEVYAVGFGVTDPTQLAALQSCSSGSGYYFDAKSSSDLMGAFQVIAGSLTKLRISQ